MRSFLGQGGEALHFDWTLNLGQVIQSDGLVLAFIGLLLTYMQRRRTNIAQTAEALRSVIFTFFENEQIQRTYYRIESGQLKFDRAKFDGTGSEDERSVDQ